MAIGQGRFVVIDTRYVNDSSYGKRSFCGRCFTVNEKAPFDKIVEVYDADGAKQFFGVNSDEYRFAEKYFSYRTHDGRRPYKLSYARWTPVDRNGWLLGGKACASWSELNNLSQDDYSIEFNTTLDKTTFDLSELRRCTSLTTTDGSSSYSGNSLCSILNRAFIGVAVPDYLRGATASIVKGRLKITFPEGKNGNLNEKETLLPCTGGKVVGLLGLDEDCGVICSNFASGEDTLAAVSRVCSDNDDFGSFMFFDWMSSYGYEVAPYLRISRILKIADWNAKQNYKYLFVEALPEEWLTGSTSETISHVYDNIAFDKPGTAICTFRNSWSSEDMSGYRYDEFLPMAVLGATDFDTDEATQNYMFQQCDAYDVTLGGDFISGIADKLSVANINFYGEVQSVGAVRAFFMPGTMLNGDAISEYACEMHMKETISTMIINSFIGNEILRPTRNTMIWLASEIDKIAVAAKQNAIIGEGVVLDSAKRLYVNSVTGSDDGYKELEKDGYCVSVSGDLTGNRWKLKYALVYNKHNQIRKVEGTHVLSVLT